MKRDVIARNNKGNISNMNENKGSYCDVIKNHFFLFSSVQ